MCHRERESVCVRVMQSMCVCVHAFLWVLRVRKSVSMFACVVSITYDLISRTDVSR